MLAPGWLAQLWSAATRSTGANLKKLTMRPCALFKGCLPDDAVLSLYPSISIACFCCCCVLLFFVYCCFCVLLCINHILTLQSEVVFNAFILSSYPISYFVTDTDRDSIFLFLLIFSILVPFPYILLLLQTQVETLFSISPYLSYPCAFSLVPLYMLPCPVCVFSCPLCFVDTVTASRRQQ